MTITPTHKIRIAAPKWTQDIQQGRAVGRDQACKEGQLEAIHSSGEGSYGWPGRQRREGGYKQAGRRAVRHQPGWHGSGLRDDQAGKQKQLGAIRKAGR